MAVQDDSSVALIPSAYGTSKVYSVIPSNGNGDFDFTRSGNATRVNKGGYIETMGSNVPRLDYPLIDGVVQDCPALLLEPSRTNVLPYSEEINNWSPFNMAVDSNVEISPDGTQTADKVRPNSTSLVNHFVSRSFSLSSGTQVSYSAFIKNAGQPRCVIHAHGKGIATFDMDLKEWVALNTANYSNHFAQYMGNGWWRISITFTLGTAQVFIGGAPSTTTSYGYAADNTTDGILVWGTQLEAGSYHTSYVKTTASIATRSADVCNGSGTSAEFNDSEGVLFVEISALSDTTTAYNSIGVGSGSSDNRIGLGFNPSSQIYVFKKTTTSWLSPQSANLELFNKVALSYNTNDNEFWLNGFKVSTNTTIGDITQPNELGFEASYGGEQFYGKTKQLMTFKTALTDSELETLTSWDSFNAMAKGQLYSIE